MISRSGMLPSFLDQLRSGLRDVCGWWRSSWAGEGTGGVYPVTLTTRDSSGSLRCVTAVCSGLTLLSRLTARHGSLSSTWLRTSGDPRFAADDREREAATVLDPLKRNCPKACAAARLPSDRKQRKAHAQSDHEYECSHSMYHWPCACAVALQALCELHQDLHHHPCRTVLLD